MFDPILNVLARLDFLGERYAVGGCVRDALMRLEPHDIDVATPLFPVEVMVRARAAGYRTVPTGIEHGTVTVLLDGEAVEVTTYRRDLTSDGRHAQVAFARTLTEDLSRRDFTLNAIALSPRGELVDPFGGAADIAAKLVRAVGHPGERFAEDYLRVVRGLRFVARFGFALPSSTARALRAAVPEVLGHVSVERVVAEFDKAFAHPGAGRFVLLLYTSGLLRRLIPEFGQLLLAQHPEFHPEGSVLEHVCLVVEQAPPSHRWHALLHDVGKAATAQPSEKGRWFSFHGHEAVGAAMIPEIAARLKLPRVLAESIEATTRLHMLPLALWKSGPELSARSVRRFQAACGVHLRDVEIVVRADRLGRGGPSDAFLEALFTPAAGVEPVLKGRHLIAAGHQPGPSFRPMLERALQHQLETGCTGVPELLAVASEGA